MTYKSTDTIIYSLIAANILHILSIRFPLYMYM